MTCSTEALLWHRCDIRRLSAAIQHYYVHYFSLCLKAFEFSLEGHMKVQILLFLAFLLGSRLEWNISFSLNGTGAFPVCVYVSQS